VYSQGGCCCCITLISPLDSNDDDAVGMLGTDMVVMLSSLLFPLTRLDVQNLQSTLGDDNIRAIVNWTLKYLSEIDIPIKR